MNQIQYLGHSCFLLTLEGTRCIIDPFIADNGLTHGLVNVDELAVDYILLTHGHGDHVSDAEGLALRNGAKIIANFEIATWYAEKGCDTVQLNIGGKYKIKDIEIRMVTAVHSSSLPDCSYGGNPGGFLIKAAGKTLYFAGDTALTKDMELIPAYYGTPDIAILPVGGVFTMDYEDAIIASQMIQCNHIIGCHFETFPPIAIDREKAIEFCAQHQVQLTLPTINQIINI